MTKRYPPKLKFQVVRDLLEGRQSVGQLAKSYGVHSNTIQKWKEAFLEKGPEIFAQDSAVAEDEERIAHLEQLLGQKEVESALLKNCLGQTRCARTTRWLW